MKFDYYVYITENEFDSFNYNNTNNLIWMDKNIIYNNLNYSSNLYNSISNFGNKSTILKVNY